MFVVAFVSVFLFVLSCLIITIVAQPFYAYGTHKDTVINVTNTEVKRYNETDKYLVFSDHGVFENTDSLLYFKFDSSDVQNELMNKGKFKITYYGWRVPFFSIYPNILTASPVKEEKAKSTEKNEVKNE